VFPKEGGKKIKKNTSLFILILLAVSSPANAQYGGGTGDPCDPYLIAEPNHLQALGADPNNWDKHFKLTADIDMSYFDGQNGRPTFNIIAPDTDPYAAGHQGATFTGSFDGNDYSVSNLTIDLSTTGYVGFFGDLDETAYIANLALENLNVSGEYHTGGLAGQSYGTITSCSVDGSVSGIQFIGGLVGANWDVGGITNCFSTGTVIGVNGSVNFGGLVGHNRGTIARCYSTASVTGIGYYLPDRLGGLAGANRGTIIHSYATGAITGDNYLGGLVASNSDGTITNCYATGTVSGQDYIGGLIGKNPGTIYLSYWDTQTSGLSQSAGGVGLTTDQMQDIDTYVGWGKNIWTIDDGNDYPHLAWENIPGIPINDSRFFEGGSGDPNDPYLIAEPNHLQAIGFSSLFWDKHFKLTADLDMSSFDGQDGRPAFNIIAPDVDPGSSGFQGTTFTGSFDGDGHTISNLTILFGSYAQYIGLFGYAGPTANVTDLVLENVNVTGNYVGALAGYNESTITNCSASGAVGDYSCYYGGGLVGSNSGNITNSSFSGSVNGEHDIGNLVGNNTGTIINCSATGDIDSFDYSGGLVGSNSGIITGCSASGNVIGYYRYIGGMVGYNTGPIMDCSTNASVSGVSEVGGLVGQNEQGLITNCHASGSITCESSSFTITNIGGLVGYNNDADITNCYYDPCSPTISGDNYLGGLVGYNNLGSITDCHVTGAVTISGTKYLGGLVGRNYEAAIKHCSSTASITGQRQSEFLGGLVGENNTGPVTNCYSTGSVTSGDYAENLGCLIGWNEGSTITDSYSTGNLTAGNESEFIGGLMGGNNDMISNCYSTGNVTSGLNSWYIGGLVGINSGVTTNCYCTGSVTGGNNSHHIGGLMGTNVIATLNNCLTTDSVTGGVSSDAIGGLVGSNDDATIENCYSTATVTGKENSDSIGGLVGYNGLGIIRNSYSTASVSGGDNSYSLGGLVGYSEYYSTILNCYTIGSVTGGDDSRRLGGLVGSNYDEGTIINCYSSTSITGGNNSINCGGLVGKTRDSAIIMCYSRGSVTAGIDSNYLGGFLGYDDAGIGIFLSCFWDSSVNPSLEGIGNGSDPNVIGETTENMQIASTFTDVGWEFVDPNEGVADPNGVWRMCVDGVDYPRLAWQYPAGDFVCPDGVELYDYALLSSLWLITPNDPAWHDFYDIYADGIIDALDLGVMHDNWMNEPGFP